MSQAPFIGREHEIGGLLRLIDKSTASLVTVQGRRRVGKSRLIEEFAKKTGYTFYRFSGLPPRVGLSPQDQRNEFSRAFGEQLGLKGFSSSDWGDLFALLASQVKEGETFILFDEISWMAADDPTFLGKLKNAWDIHFNKNPKLILVLCGSVSAWIDKNILRSTGYVGRISHSLHLEELPLMDCNQLLQSVGTHYSPWEKFLVLSVTGGIPRYIEELSRSETAERAIGQLCFEKEGLLFREFDNIFSDLLSKRNANYKRIVLALQDRNLSYSEICETLGVQKSSHVNGWLEDLVKSGFLSRDYTWDITSKKESKLSRYRIKDNYIRFYLKYIQPNLGRIQKGHFNDYSLSNLPGWNGIIGLQFENLVLANRKWILEKLRLRPEDVLNDNPYFQRETQKYRGCQVDYLVQTRFNTLFVCEVKFSKKEISSQILGEMREKVKRLLIPKGYACNPVLIHVNGVSCAVEESRFFSHIIDLSETLTTI
ncbi:MAG: hypothetical protein S4CHLAM45_11650 [Chlamydiales bacterium]|nr:hypothetical protein [Chlamydiales bacterium]MCH9619657.1 hypothetical protein [Chlamydiales bacterium]MCH9623263.1 hypothetical protein [Chlamydiales bacterium]